MSPRLPVTLSIDESILDLLEVLGVDCNLIHSIQISAIWDERAPFGTLVLDAEHLTQADSGALMGEHRRTLIEFRTTTYGTGS